MSASLEAQETIGNYALERSLARGSMGHVYVARHTLTHAQVALKILRADLAADTQAEERFLREIRAAAHIGHAGIVKVHDAGRSSDGRLYLAMELLHGETLEERMARSQGERLSIMEWLLRVLEPLAAAHAQGIVHRDLKPANVFIARMADGQEQVKLLDFGLARDTREKSGTETGIALGTPYYMSPEQATRPKLVGPTSDVWSVGVMMYEVLSGQMPFEGETLHAVVVNSTTTPHLPLGEREPHLDRHLCQLVDSCLSKEPSGRPADASQLLMRLRSVLADPALRMELSTKSARHDLGSSDAPAGASFEHMPFADTAISMRPRLLDSEMRPTVPRSNNLLWFSAIGLVALGVLGFLWAVTRSDSQAGDSQPQRAVERQPKPTTAQPTSTPLEPAPTRENTTPHDDEGTGATKAAAASSNTTAKPIANGNAKAPPKAAEAAANHEPAPQTAAPTKPEQPASAPSTETPTATATAEPAPGDPSPSVPPPNAVELPNDPSWAPPEPPAPEPEPEPAPEAPPSAPPSTP